MTPIQTIVLLVLAASSEASRTRNRVQKVQKTARKSQPAEKHNSTKAGVSSKALQVCMGEMFDMMQNPEQQRTATRCEKEGKFVELVLADMQKDDEPAAKAAIEKLFTKCGPKDCASAVAPQLIEMLRLSGAGVSRKCQDEITKTQSDEKLVTAAVRCDQTNKISEQTLAALDAGNLTTAQSFAEQALEKCQNVSTVCAKAAAPAVLNTAMMRAQEEQAMEAMMNSAPVMIIQPVIMVEAEGAPDSKGNKKAFSLLSMAASGHKKQFRRFQMRGAKATALLQVGTHHGPWISELLVQLAIRQ